MKNKGYAKLRWANKIYNGGGGGGGDVEMAASSHKHGLNDDRTTAPN